jgi:hypothetical protein
MTQWNTLLENPVIGLFSVRFSICVLLRLLFNLRLFVANIYTTCFVLIGQL